MTDKYYEFLKEHGNIPIYGIHCKAYNFKNATQSIVKSQRDFKLTDMTMLERTNNKLAYLSISLR